MSVFNDDYCEELADQHLFPNGKFGYKVERDIPLSLSPSKYFSQRFLNYTQQFYLSILIFSTFSTSLASCT